jgi:shikimate kinase
MRYWLVERADRSIVLIGMMGAGKSSVAHCLRTKTGLAGVDTDEIVMSKFGISIPEIFSVYGEDKFRKAETEALRALTVGQQAIIVTGGGIVLRKENVSLLRRLGVVVWLEADENTLFNRASCTGNRPLLQTANPRIAFGRMLQARLPLYAKTADIRIDTSVLTQEEVSVAILSKLRKLAPSSRAGSSIPVTVQ